MYPSFGDNESKGNDTYTRIIHLLVLSSSMKQEYILLRYSDLTDHNLFFSRAKRMDEQDRHQQYMTNLLFNPSVGGASL